MTAPGVIKDTKVALTIDGTAVEIKKGTTILQAAASVGIEIPTLCYLKKIRPIGSCRICSVEVEGVDASVMSCATPATEGMVVNTQTDSIKKYRQEMMKMILVNHPLDCPVCERSGECSLQNRTFNLGVTGHEWKTNSVDRHENVDWGLIQYNQNLCIMCERCIKVCRESQGVGAYKIDGVGYDSKINTVTEEKLDCDFCGTCISVCPVGALSSGMYFTGRSWEMDRADAICQHCSVGCSLQINSKNGRVVRVTTSRDATGINNGSLCARGRFGYEYMDSEDRLDAPLLRTGHGFVATSWDDAIGQVATKLAEAKAASGGKGVVGIGSERATNEDNYVFQKFFREVLGSGNLDNIGNMTASPTCSHLLENVDPSLMANFDDVRAGNSFVFIGADGSNETPVVSNIIREAANNHGAEVAIAYSTDGTYNPGVALQLNYDYAKLNDFMVALIAKATAVAKENGTEVDGEFASEIEKAAASLNVSNLLRCRIARLVKMIDERKAPVFFIGREAQYHPQRAAIIQNVVNLARLVGGKIMILRELCNSQGVNDMGVVPNLLPGYKAEDNAGLRSAGDVVSQMESGDVKVLVVLDEDILRRYYRADRFRAAMQKVDYIVLIDQFYSNTSLEADVIFPSLIIAERGGSFTNMEGRIQNSVKALTGSGGKAGWEILTMISKRLGSDLGYGSIADIQSEIAAEVPLYKNIKTDGLVDYSSLGSSAISSKLALASSVKVEEHDFVVLQELSLYSLGVYADHCPSLRQVSGRPYSDPHLKGKPFIEINSTDADSLGLSDNDELNIRYGLGEWKGKVRVGSRAAAGTIRVPSSMDKSLLKEIEIASSGKLIPCVNLAIMRNEDA